MKFLGVLLAIFAVSCVRANAEECTEERGEACIDHLLTAISDYGFHEAVVCRGLLSSVDCLKEAVDDCSGERNSAVDDVFEKLDKLLSKCKAYLSNDWYEELEVVKCYLQNEDYLRECESEKTEQALNLLLQKDDVDENIMKCARYRLMSVCLVDRIREKCGEKVASMEEKNLSNTPTAEACNAVEGIDDTGIFEGIHLIGEEKRK